LDVNSVSRRAVTSTKATKVDRILESCGRLFLPQRACQSLFRGC
jgi:hypothetical protein